MPSRIACTAASVERSRSVSSMRSTNWPPRWRASSQQYSAVRAPPICRKPVGLGAKRVRTVMRCSFAGGETVDFSRSCPRGRRTRGQAPPDRRPGHQRNGVQGRSARWVAAARDRASWSASERLAATARCARRRHRWTHLLPSVPGRHQHTAHPDQRADAPTSRAASQRRPAGPGKPAASRTRHAVATEGQGSPAMLIPPSRGPGHAHRHRQ